MKMSADPITESHPFMEQQSYLYQAMVIKSGSTNSITNLGDGLNTYSG